MTSTLQGLFINYSATFEHLDGQGNPRLSLIDEVRIHEMNRLVHAGGPFADGKPDFLVNDVADTRDLPDTLMQRPESVEPTSITSLTDDGFAVFDPVVVTFDNGVRVVLNTNRIVAGETFFSAASPGGTSLVADEDVIDALSAADIVTSGGVAEFNQSEVAQILAGADTEVRAVLTPYQEQFAGSSPTAVAGGRREQRRR